MTDRFVVDSSVALKWFLKEQDADRADNLLAAEKSLLAPDFILAEVANGLRRHQRTGIISATNVQEAIAGLPSVFTELLPTEALIAVALQASQEIDHSVYDCLFLAMSRLRDAALITADVVFADKLSKTSDAKRVVLLADWK